MAQFLLVVEGLAASGADVAMSVTEVDYKAAMFDLCFTQPVHGYVWCNKHHDWMRSNEAMVCERCAEDTYAKWEKLADEQLEAAFGVHVDAMQDAGASWLEIVDALGEDVDRTQAEMMMIR